MAHQIEHNFLLGALVLDLKLWSILTKKSPSNQCFITQVEVKSFWLLLFSLLACMQSKEYKNWLYREPRSFSCFWKKSFPRLQFQSYSYLYCHLKFYPVLTLGVFNSTNTLKILKFKILSWFYVVLQQIY